MGAFHARSSAPEPDASAAASRRLFGEPAADPSAAIDRSGAGPSSSSSWPVDASSDSAALLLRRNGAAASAAASSGGAPCGACKFLRRKCVKGCIFAPYFGAEHGAARFAAVHKIFGASNVSKLLQRIPPHKRLEAVITISYEAQARITNPVYGCVTQIAELQKQVLELQNQLSMVQAQLTSSRQLASMAIHQNQQQGMAAAAPFQQLQQANYADSTAAALPLLQQQQGNNNNGGGGVDAAPPVVSMHHYSGGRIFLTTPPATFLMNISTSCKVEDPELDESRDAQHPPPHGLLYCAPSFGAGAGAGGASAIVAQQQASSSSSSDHHAHHQLQLCSTSHNHCFNTIDPSSSSSHRHT